MWEVRVQSVVTEICFFREPLLHQLIHLFVIGLQEHWRSSESVEETVQSPFCQSVVVF